MFLEMNTQQEVSYLTSNKENQNAKELLSSIKEPFLQIIEQTKSNFRNNHLKFACRREKSNLSEIIPEEIYVKKHQTISSNISSQDCITSSNLDKIIITQSSNDEGFARQPKEIVFRQWKLQKEVRNVFHKFEDVSETYSKMFNKKIALKGHHKFQNQSFKMQQKMMIQRIYEQIRNKGYNDSVDFVEIIKFFKTCPLFYHIYNISPDTIEDAIKDNAHHFENKLTHEEFLNLFLINNRTNQEYGDNKTEINKICVLDSQTWGQLKQIFAIFDTFGNEKIQIKQFFNKIKINIQYKHLLSKKVIYYPKINRYYPLKKIIFECEYKLKLSNEMMKWQQIKHIIQTFNHQKLPTIDSIEKNNISNANISCYSNSFMINDKILNHLKQTYDRLPKYYDNFVKVKQFCTEFHEIQQSNRLLNEVIRNQPEIVTLGRALNSLIHFELEYLDLDELLQWFSLKGINKELTQSLLEKKENAYDDSSSDEEQYKARSAKANKKITENLPKKFHYQQKFGAQITKIQQFKLSKTKQTIRAIKVKQMIRQKEQKQQKELNYKIKANPIPASINNQKYQLYRKKMDQIKEQNLAKLQKYNENDAQLMKHLYANTKLFEKPKEIIIQQEKYIFEPKPIPWFVKVNLLDKFENQRQKMKRANKKIVEVKYQKQWINLPPFMQQIQNISEQQVDLQETQQKFFECSHPVTKVKEIPNFQYLHKRFQQQLEQKRKVPNLTAVKPFNLSQSKPKSIQYSPLHVPLKKKHKKIQESNFYIGSTLKYQSHLQFNRQLQQQQENKKIYEKLTKKERKKHQKIFAKFMRIQLKKELKNEESQIKKKSKKSKLLSKTNKQMAQIYKRVFERPFLFQTNSCSSKNNGFFKDSLKEKVKPIKLDQQSQQKVQFIDNIDDFQIIPKYAPNNNPTLNKNASKAKIVENYEQKSPNKQNKYSF